MSIALERGALETALVAEQGEGALLRQELEVQAGASEALESALAEVRQQLSDTQAALNLQTGMECASAAVYEPAMVLPQCILQGLAGMLLA